MEEEKAQKKIAETKKRAQEIIALKARNEQALRERLEKANDGGEEIHMNKDRASKQRQDLRIGAAQAQEQLAKEKRDMVLLCRRERQEAEMAIQRQREQNMQHAHECKEAIKAHESAMQRALQQKKLERNEAARRELDQKVLEEEEQRTLAEAQVRKMEQEEAYLIDQLQKTQEAQRLAYDDLEGALNYSIGDKFERPQNKP